MKILEQKTQRIFSVSQYASNFLCNGAHFSRVVYFKDKGRAGELTTNISRSSPGLLLPSVVLHTQQSPRERCEKYPYKRVYTSRRSAIYIAFINHRPPTFAISFSLINHKARKVLPFFLALASPLHAMRITGVLQILAYRGQ